LCQSTSSPSSSPAALTLAHLQAELGLSKPTISRLIKDRRIASFRVGRRVLVSRAALARFIAKAERGAAIGATR
jgi:excisionase family DNA binding protein